MDRWRIDTTVWLITMHQAFGCPDFHYESVPTAETFN